MNALNNSYKIIDEYCHIMTLKGRGERTMAEYRNRLRMCSRHLYAAKLNVHPEKIGMEEIHFLIATALNGLSNKYKHHTITIMGKYLRVMAKNNVVADMDILWPRSIRRVTWLTPEQLMYILDTTEGLDHVIIHFAGQLGLRCAEVTNLKLSDFEEPWIYVLGKGYQEGKLARVYYHPDTKAIVSKWMERRNSIVETHKALYPTIPIPDNLLLHNWCTEGRAKPYCVKRIGNRILDLSKNYDFKFSIHTLRRAYATFLSASGVDKFVIRDALRHEDIKTTLLYIQEDLQPMLDARNKQYEMEKRLKCKL